MLVVSLKLSETMALFPFTSTLLLLPARTCWFKPSVLLNRRFLQASSPSTMSNPFPKMVPKAAVRAEQSSTVGDQVVEEQRNAAGVFRRTTTRFVNTTHSLGWIPPLGTSQTDAASAYLEDRGSRFGSTSTPHRRCERLA